jgi:hypothetical protein
MTPSTLSESMPPVLTQSRSHNSPSPSNVQTYVDRIKIKNEKFQDIVFNSNTGNDPEFKELRKGELSPPLCSDRASPFLSPLLS